MAISATISGSVRQGTRRSYTSGGTQTLDMNLGGDLLVAQGLPERADLVAKGYSFSAQIPAANAFTLLITIPTTLAEMSLQNANATATNVCYIIDRFWVKAVTSMASACWLTPLSQLVRPGTTLVANNTAVLRTNLSGATNTDSAQICIASTATGCLTDKWNHHQGGNVSPTTNIAACVEVLCYGRYIVPPQGSFNINAQESVSGGTAIVGVEWHEVVLNRG